MINGHMRAKKLFTTNKKKTTISTMKTRNDVSGSHRWTELWYYFRWPRCSQGLFIERISIGSAGRALQWDGRRACYPRRCIRVGRRTAGRRPGHPHPQTKEWPEMGQKIQLQNVAKILDIFSNNLAFFANILRSFEFFKILFLANTVPLCDE